MTGLNNPRRDLDHIDFYDDAAEEGKSQVDTVNDEGNGEEQ